MKRVAGVAAAALLVLTAPSAPGSEHTAASEGCTGARVERLFRTFIRAYNAGNFGRLDQLWAAEPDFEWYSVSPDERERAAAYDRNTLLPYFVQRHAVNDRLIVKSFGVGPPNEAGHYGIAYHLRRSSDQARATGRYHGKAGATTTVALPTLDNPAFTRRCQLVVWSMGRS